MPPAAAGRPRCVLVTWEDGLAELVAWAREADAADGFAQADDELRARGLVSGPIGRRTAS